MRGPLNRGPLQVPAMRRGQEGTARDEDRSHALGMGISSRRTKNIGRESCCIPETEKKVRCIRTICGNLGKRSGTQSQRLPAAGLPCVRPRMHAPTSPSLPLSLSPFLPLSLSPSLPFSLSPSLNLSSLPLSISPSPSRDST